MEKANDWIKLYRRIKDWGWYGDVYVFKLFIHLLIEANHNKKQINGIIIERGSLLTSIAGLSKGAMISETAVKNSLKKLLATGEITEEIKPNKYRIISITNYSDYQKSVGSPKTNSKTNSKTDNKTDNKTTNKNIRKNECLTDIHSEKKEKKAAAPHALEERALAVSYNEMRQYQIDNHIGSGELITEFYDGFHDSETKIPDNWQQLYAQYAAADLMAQITFIEKLKRGEYRDKWGTADAGT